MNDSRSLMDSYTLTQEALDQRVATIQSYHDIQTSFDALQEENASTVFEILMSAILIFAASDIHIDAAPEGARIRMRIDGILHDVAFMNQHLFSLVLSRVKMLSGLKNQRSRSTGWTILPQTTRSRHRDPCLSCPVRIWRRYRSSRSRPTSPYISTRIRDAQRPTRYAPQPDQKASWAYFGNGTNRRWENHYPVRYSQIPPNSLYKNSDDRRPCRIPSTRSVSNTGR